MVIINLIKYIMAKIDVRRFIPTQEETQKGIQPMTKEEILEALAKYKVQNPTKYAQKKEELFARYNLKPEEIPEVKKDADDIELEELKAKIKK